MRPAAAALLAAALLACTPQSAVSPSPSLVSSAISPAANLRTQLDLLFAEHVMLIAKETEGAVNHSDEYVPYAALLGANTSDLSAVIGRALGSTASDQFTTVWNMQNSYLVDYAIGVVTHNDDKAKASRTGLLGTFDEQFGQWLHVSIGWPISVSGPLETQLQDEMAFVDNLFAQKYAYFYADLHSAYILSRDIGYPMADQLVRRFPDTFPGRVDGRDVIARVDSNLLLQENAYLATMATDASTAGRGAEKTAAVAALARLASKPWTDWDAAIVSYSAGSGLQAASFVDQLVSATGAQQTAVRHYVDATVKVVDDQKSKSTKTLADDDRAAATATQPIADSSAQG